MRKSFFVPLNNNTKRKKCATDKSAPGIRTRSGPRVLSRAGGRDPGIRENFGDARGL